MALTRKEKTYVGVAIAGAIGAGALAIYLAVRESGARGPATPGEPSGGSADPGGGPMLELTNGDIVQTVGKHWILTNKIATSGMAANYGWHFQGPTFGGQAFEASVSLPGVRVIQGVGTRHDRSHADYSQTVVLARQACLWKGQPARIEELLRDPEASRALSSEGPLGITRQPGVPFYLATPAPPGAAPPVTREEVLALPDSLPAREAILLDWVVQGRAETTWATIESGDVTFTVMADALRFGGVRVSASATLEQQIADVLDASLLTARMADLAFAAASTVIKPIPLGASAQMSSTAWMVNESDKIEAAIGKATA